MTLMIKRRSMYEVTFYAQSEKDDFPLSLYKLAGAEYNDELIFNFEYKPYIDVDMVDGIEIDGDVYVYVAGRDVWEPCTRLLSNDILNEFAEFVGAYANEDADEYIMDREIARAESLEDR